MQIRSYVIRSAAARSCHRMQSRLQAAAFVRNDSGFAHALLAMPGLHM